MIYVIFRLAKNYNCKLSTLITCNYFFAALLGVSLFQPFHYEELINSVNWLHFGVFLGFLFMVMFYLIGISSQKAGISVTTLANKLSLVFPVLFSLLYFNEEISTINYVGLLTATIAVFLSVYRKDLKKTNLIFVLLPVLIFFGSGFVDSIVKYVQAVKISDNEVTLYTTVVFLAAFLFGIISKIFDKSKKHVFHIPTLILAFFLGMVNFGSLYFMIRALNHSSLDSSLVFALNNMSIVALTTLLGTLLFKEKLNKINFAGIVLAIFSLYFLL